MTRISSDSTPAAVSAAPATWEGTAPEDLVGRYVSVRPYYHVPSSRSSMTSARSAYAFAARVTETLGEMVVVEIEWRASRAPWEPRASFHPRELHQSTCACPACAPMGDGIAALHGA